MKHVILIAVASALLEILSAGCGESEESKRNLAAVAREAETHRAAREKTEADRRQKIEEAQKWHRTQMDAYEKSMTPEKK